MLLWLVVAGPALSQESWQPLDLFGGVPKSLVIDPANNQTVYAAFANAVCKSVDGGETWTQSNEGLANNGANGLGIAPSQPSMLYAVRGIEDVYRSLDAAQSWTLRHQCPDCGIGSFGAVAVDPGDPEQIYICDVEFGVMPSADGGATLPSLGPECDGQLHVSASGVPFVASATGSVRASRSTNLGDTWSPIGPAPDAVARGVATDPTNPLRVYLSAQSTVVPGLFHISDDGGSTWGPGGDGLTTRGRLLIPAGQPSTIFLYTDSAIWRSIDSGAHFAPLVHDLPLAPPGVVLRRLEADPVDASRMFALLNTDGLYRSVDGGASWQIADQGVRGGQVSRVVFDPADPARVYAIQFSDIHRSTDGGATWSRAMDGIGAGSASRIWLHPTTPLTLLAAAGGDLFRSTDGGASWSLWSSLGPSALVFHPTDPETLYAAAGTDVFRSTNGGVDWTPADALLAGGTVGSLAIDPADPLHLFAGTGSGLWETTNGGTWWEFTGHPGGGVQFGPPGSSTVYMFQGSVLYRSDDGGETFVAKPTGGSVSAFTFSPGSGAGTLYAVGSGVWRSASRGDVWEELTVDGLVRPGGRSLAVDPGDPARLLLGTAENGLYALAQLSIFADGFESGTTSAWSATVP